MNRETIRERRERIFDPPEALTLELKPGTQKTLKLYTARAAADFIVSRWGIKLNFDRVQVSRWYQIKGKMLRNLQRTSTKVHARTVGAMSVETQDYDLGTKIRSLVLRYRPLEPFKLLLALYNLKLNSVKQHGASFDIIKNGKKTIFIFFIY